MPADMLIYGLREPKPPFQSWNEPLINKVKTSKEVACVCVCEKSSLMNHAWIISIRRNERISVQQKKITAVLRSDLIQWRLNDWVSTEIQISFSCINMINVIISQPTQKSQQAFKSKWRTKAHLHSLSSRQAPLATECYAGWNQTIKVKLHQISNTEQLKWNYSMTTRTNLGWVELANQSKINLGPKSLHSF